MVIGFLLVYNSSFPRCYSILGPAEKAKAIIDRDIMITGILICIGILLFISGLFLMLYRIYQSKKKT